MTRKDFIALADAFYLPDPHIIREHMYNGEGMSTRPRWLLGCCPRDLTATDGWTTAGACVAPTEAGRSRKHEIRA